VLEPRRRELDAGLATVDHQLRVISNALDPSSRRVSVIVKSLAR